MLIILEIRGCEGVNGFPGIEMSGQSSNRLEGVAKLAKLEDLKIWNFKGVDGLHDLMNVTTLNNLH